MDLNSVKKLLEGERSGNAKVVDELPLKIFDPLIMQGVHVDLIQPGRILLSMNVPLRLLNVGGSIHGGAVASIVDIVGSAVIITVGVANTGVSVEINVSYLGPSFANEEVEIEGKALRIGKSVAVVNVEMRNKTSGKIIAQGRHTKFLAVHSKI